VGELDPENIATPSVYVHRLVKLQPQSEGRVLVNG
jgi:3-oxoadipate CoA-transferase, alpha subunit